MNFCEKCGSTSRDKDGFCGGCGGRWPLDPVESASQPPQSGEASPLSKFASPAINVRPNPLFFGLTDIQPKKVWLAVGLALMFGPFGLIYCTMTGAIVMALVSIPIGILLGSWGYLIVPAISAFWAWRAARQSPSILD